MMLIRLIVLSLMFTWDVLGSALVTLPITRTFHDTAGRPLIGDLLKVKEDQIYLQRDLDGAHFWVSRNALSEDDQKWLLTHFPEQSGEDTTKQLEWPDRAEPGESINIKVVEETYKDNRFIYASEHFQYESPGRLTRTLVKEFAEVFEATFATVMAMPLPFKELPPDEPMRVRIFDTPDSYRQAGGLPNSAGVYLYSEHICLVPIRSLGLEPTSTGYRKKGEINHRILLHEVTHQVMHKWRLPVWLQEGIAEYVERMPYSNGTVYFRRYDVKQVLQDMEERIEQVRLLHPQSLLTMSHQEWNSGFGTGDVYGLTRNYLSAFVMTAFYLSLSDDESAYLIKEYLEITLAEEDGRDRLLFMHSSGVDLETRFLRALRGIGIQAEFVE